MSYNKMSVKIISLSLVIVSLLLLSACGSKEAVSVYPPIVFKPVPGQLDGGAIADNLKVTAVVSLTGKALKDAEVYVHQGEPYELKAQMTTNDQGTADFTGKGINGPVTVTVTCNKTEAYDTVTMMNVNAANLIIPMIPRKDPEKSKTALTFLGLDAGDTGLSLSRNDVPYNEKAVKSGKLEQDPWTMRVPDKPVAFSALVTDGGGNTSKFGYTVEPDGPIPEATPAQIMLNRVTGENVKMTKGSIDNPPANLDMPTAGWDPYKRYIFQIYSNAGIAGDVVAGFANLTREYGYQAFIVNTPELDKMRLEVSALNRSDAWSEMATAIQHFSFDNAPMKQDFHFIDAPKNLQISKVDGQIYPNLVWEISTGNLTQLEIFHADYNYHWTIYAAGENITTMTLPPLEPGSPGALQTEEIYRFRVTNWLVPGLDFNASSFQAINETVTHKARSTLVKFMVKGVEQPQE